MRKLKSLKLGKVLSQTEMKNLKGGACICSCNNSIGTWINYSENCRVGMSVSTSLCASGEATCSGYFG